MASQKVSGASGEGLASKVLRYPLLCAALVLCALACGFFLSLFILEAGGIAGVLEKTPFPAGPAWGRAALRLSLFALFYGIAACAGNAAGTLLGLRAERDCRIDWYDSLAAKDSAFFFRRKPEELLPGVMENAEAAGRAVYPGFFRLLSAGAACLASLFATALIHPALLPLPLLYTVFIFFTLKSYDWHTGAAVLEEDALRERLAADIAEAKAGRETIAAQAMEAETLNRFNTDAAFLRDAGVQREKAAARYAPHFLFQVFLAAAIWEGFFLQQKGFIGFGGLVSFIGFFPVFFYAAKTCPAAYIDYRKSSARLFPSQRPSALSSVQPAAKEKAIRGTVEFDNVFFSYDSTLVLRRASFFAEEGAFVVITGAAGSGKTTLARLAAGVLEPDMGTDSIDAVDIREWNPQTLRSGVFFIAQDAFLFPLSVRENIALGSPDAEEKDILEAARKAQAHGFISRLKNGYDTLVGEGGTQLSADKRLRLALARVFLTNPRILVIDDAAVSGDSVTEDEVLRAIQNAAEGRTTFVVSHRLSQIRWADLILFVKGGEILCQGGHERLVVESADYRRIFSGL
jgi:ATP-binding cassette subfamily B protein